MDTQENSKPQESNDNTSVPSEPSAHGYQPGDDELAEGAQTRDPAEGGEEVPAPAEAAPEA